MTAFEKLVRPFQSPNVTPLRRSATSGGSSAGGPVSVAIGGIASNGAQLAFAFSSSALIGSPITVSYTLNGGDTLQTATLGIIAAINANAVLSGAGIYATGVAGSPAQFTINQPTSLSPQATITGSATAAMTVALSAGNVAISPGRGRVTMQTANSSFDFSRSYYVKKWPKEMTFDEVLARNIPGLFPPPP